MADERQSRPMPTEMWGAALTRPRRPAGQASARPSLRANVVVLFAPPLLALVALALLAVVSYERSDDQIARARQEVLRLRALATAAAPVEVAAAEERLDRALDESRRARTVVGLGLVGALGLGGLAAFRVNRRLVRPIRAAEAAAGRVNAGEVGVRLDPSAAGEIGELATAVNAMAEDLDRSRSSLAGTTILESSPDLVLVVGEQEGDGGVHAVVRYASTAATVMLGRPSAWLTDVPLASFVHPDDRSKLAAILLQPGESPAGGASEIRFSHVQGRWIEGEVAAVDLRDDPSVRGIALFVRDLFGRKAQEEELRHLALHDPLTRLANRTLFTEHVDHALARTRRSPVRPHAVLLVDLDGFKTINDSLGHAAGDEVLVELAERLRTRIRPGDTAARLGGDEFGILLENSPEDDAGVVAQRIL
ncbi:MAG TPA: diguanylate cyclase, partial [Acidimicrobiales bacterium]|nr:diguanylate cyclase [Acidimicrobiales bacterium]